MKFDMGRAWNETTEMIGGNLGLIATILGLFYFLPTFAISILFPEIANPTPPEAPRGADPRVVLENISAFVQQSWAESWPFFLATTLLQYVGAIAVLALFRDNEKPTVGEALKAGFIGTPTYVATGIIVAIGAALLIGIPLGIGFAIHPALGVVLALFAVVAIIYISVKMVLIPAVIGMEGQLNPITAIKRSWSLTKGNSLRIFLFLLVLFIVVGLIVGVASGILTLVFAAMGDTIALIGTALVSSLSGLFFGGLFLLVIGAIYRQLASGGQPNELETFE